MRKDTSEVSLAIPDAELRKLLEIVDEVDPLEFAREMAGLSGKMSKGVMKIKKGKNQKVSQLVDRIVRLENRIGLALRT